jgi:hypothetical protein
MIPWIPRRAIEIACLLGMFQLTSVALGVERVPRMIKLVGTDALGDPAFTPPSAADSPAESSGPFDTTRGDLGVDEDLANGTAKPKRRPAAERQQAADKIPDPLRGTPLIKPEVTGRDAMEVLSKLLPGRSDSPYDWYAPVEPLHVGCEPYALPPCVPPPPCHPSEPPQPFDLVGLRGVPSGGPIYRGPCEPRTGTHDHCHFPWYHRLHDRFVDHFYRWK